MQMNISLNKTEYDNMVELRNRKIDHVIINNSISRYLVIHGYTDGDVSYNGCKISFEVLSKELRKELQMSDTDELICYVICCYGLKQISYIDKYTYIVSMFSNEQEVFYCLEANQSCTFSY